MAPECRGPSAGTRGKRVHSDLKADTHAGTQRTRQKCSVTPAYLSGDRVGDESAGPRGVSGRGAVAVSGGGTGPGSGNLEIWNPGNLRGCGARQVFRFSGFQVFTLLGPAPAGGVAPGTESCSGTDQRAEKLET